MSLPHPIKPLLALSIFLSLGAAVSASSATAPASPDSAVIRMTADRQSYDLDQKKYTLDGRVTVAYQNMSITGSRADVEMDPSGKPQVARFVNRPLFRAVKPSVGEDTVTGDRINVYLNDDRYAAQGNVQSHMNTVASDPFFIRSDMQEFDHKNRVVSASGNVQVDYKGSRTSSALANVRMNENGRAERVIFAGGAHVRQPDGEVQGEKITIMVDSGNLIAEKNVRTRMDLATAKSPQNKDPKGAAQPGDPDRVLLTSDYQQYDKASDTILASGNVRILYGDYTAVGPKATFKLKNKDLDRILLTGRATITENGRTVTADRITITTHPRNFDAVGNVKVNFKTQSATSPSPSGTATRPAGGKPAPAKSPIKPAPSSKPLPADDASDY
jgi:lipopolysaccharide export system protein LptA